MVTARLGESLPVWLCAFISWLIRKPCARLCNRYMWSDFIEENGITWPATLNYTGNVKCSRGTVTSAHGILINNLVQGQCTVPIFFHKRCIMTYTLIICNHLYYIWYRKKVLIHKDQGRGGGLTLIFFSSKVIIKSFLIKGKNHTQSGDQKVSQKGAILF